MQHILVPTDFSANAMNALDYAMQLANRFGSSITIYHACQIPASGIHRPAPSIIEQEKRTVINETRRKLKLICEKAREAGSVCFTDSSVSPVPEGILEMAKQTGAGLIVMGTRGAGGVPAWLFGSTTAEVIQSSLIPVLAVPKTASYNTIEKIVFATDYRDSDFEFIRKLVHIATVFKSELSILHVETDKGEFRSEALFESFRERIRSSFDYDKISFHLMEKADVVNAISKFANNDGANIISMATSRRGLFDRIFNKSITKEMAYITKIPLLAFNS
jgi:nucleotide-binding universal stress UspA family protein